jgi:hypothetical protein
MNFLKLNILLLDYIEIKIDEIISINGVKKEKDNKLVLVKVIIIIIDSWK